jgi:hypothetical protein
MRPDMLHSLLLTLPFVFCTACDIPGNRAQMPAFADTCHALQSVARLPDAVRETSGLAASSANPRVLWTHNDRGNGALLHAVSTEGALLGSVAVSGAESIDWEDIDAAPCASGTCLYIADIGDNDGVRETVTIYEVAEPSPGGGATSAARALHARYPDGPHNAESIFILRDGTIYIVTKGDDGPIAVYRLPKSQQEQVAVLERVREVMAQPDGRQDRVTGAAASPDGSRVAIRSYTSLYVYAADALLGGGDAAPMKIDLRSLGEPQGEGVAISSDGTVWLSSEAEDGDASPMLSRLTCPLPQ